MTKYGSRTNSPVLGITSCVDVTRFRSNRFNDLSLDIEKEVVLNINILDTSLSENTIETQM